MHWRGASESDSCDLDPVTKFPAVAESDLSSLIPLPRWREREASTYLAQFERKPVRTRFRFSSYEGRRLPFLFRSERRFAESLHCAVQSRQCRKSPRDIRGRAAQARRAIAPREYAEN